MIIKKYFNLENFLIYKGKYKKLFCFALMFENFSLNKKKCEKEYFFSFQALQFTS